MIYEFVDVKERGRPMMELLLSDSPSEEAIDDLRRPAKEFYFNML